MTKYESFFDELTALEKQIYFFKRKYEELKNYKDENKLRITELEKENMLLKNRVEELEEKLRTGDYVSGQYMEDLFSGLEEKTKLRKRIDDLIQKVDNHLSS
jgi:predicted nuclease with TOPRIM domain